MHVNKAYICPRSSYGGVQCVRGRKSPCRPLPCLRNQGGRFGGMGSQPQCRAQPLPLIILLADNLIQRQKQPATVTSCLVINSLDANTMDYTVNQVTEPTADDPNANTVNDDASAEEGSFILPEVTTVMADVSNFFQAQLLPRCREIESEVNALTYEANAVTNRAEVEKQEVVKELSRLSELVLSFQQRIQQFLHFGSFQG